MELCYGGKKGEKKIQYLQTQCLQRMLYAKSPQSCPWTVAYQVPLSMGFSRQKCQSRLPFPSPGYLPDPGSEPWPPILQADSEPPGKPRLIIYGLYYVEAHSLYTHTDKSFYSKQMVTFIKCSYCIDQDNHMILNFVLLTWCITLICKQ